LPRRSELFNIAVQSGAILAITLVYRERVWALVSGLRERANRD
jgi:undecaprenyl-diphosphatase